MLLKRIYLNQAETIRALFMQPFLEIAQIH